MDLRKLADPFPASDVEFRVQSAGKKEERVWARVLAYINNRAIMERLDDVCGPGNWRNEFRHDESGAVLCGISIRIRHGDAATVEWVTKWDGAEKTDIEAVKGGLSNAMKRAGVQWGIGRYLYELEEGYANVNEKGAHYQGAKKDAPGKPGYPAFKWDPPALPAWALPGGSGKPGTKNETRSAARQSTQADNGRAPQGDGGTKSPASVSVAPSAPRSTSDQLASLPEDIGRLKLNSRYMTLMTTDELTSLIAEQSDNPRYTRHIDAANQILAARQPDAAVARMKQQVENEEAELPWTKTAHQNDLIP